MTALFFTWIGRKKNTQPNHDKEKQRRWKICKTERQKRKKNHWQQPVVTTNCWNCLMGLKKLLCMIQGLETEENTLKVVCMCLCCCMRSCEFWVSLWCVVLLGLVMLFVDGEFFDKFREFYKIFCLESFKKSLNNFHQWNGPKKVPKSLKISKSIHLSFHCSILTPHKTLFVKQHPNTLNTLLRPYIQ